MVLNTVDLEASEENYREVLGFRVSDWSEDQIFFMRINRDHHSITINRAKWAGESRGLRTAVGRRVHAAIGQLNHSRIKPLWGPGRHGPGNNTFAYFADPAGLVPEVTSEVEQIDEDDYLPRVWNRIADQLDLWGPPGRHHWIFGTTSPP